MYCAPTSILQVFGSEGRLLVNIRPPIKTLLLINLTHKYNKIAHLIFLIFQVREYALRRQYIGALNVSNFFPKIQLACQLSLLTSSKLNWRMKRVN